MFRPISDLNKKIKEKKQAKKSESKAKEKSTVSGATASRYGLQGRLRQNSNHQINESPTPAKCLEFMASIQQQGELSKEQSELFEKEITINPMLLVTRLPAWNDGRREYQHISAFEWLVKTNRDHYLRILLNLFDQEKLSSSEHKEFFEKLCDQYVDYLNNAEESADKSIFFSDAMHNIMTTRALLSSGL